MASVKALSVRNMAVLRAFILAVLLVGSYNFESCVAETTGGIKRSCNFSTVFNFGDSNSDTGGLLAGLGWFAILPFGQTFFKKPSGRYCDGRLVVDFLCQGIHLPFLSPYLESVGSNFRHGVNFAIAGATVAADLVIDGVTVGGSSNPFPLPVQVSQFKRFKGLVLNRGSQGVGKLLPPPDAFDKALYTFDIGQNDINRAFRAMLTETLINNLVIRQIISSITSYLKELYNEGGRNFVVHNTGPLGCLPSILNGIRSDLSEVDEYGCGVAYNNASQTFNTQLKMACDRLRAQLPGATIVYVDIYSIKYSLIANASKYGFEHPLASCCGYGGLPYNLDVSCANTGTVNGTVVTGGPCKDPSKSVSWDGTHYSESANFHVWSHIMSTNFSDPPISPYQACQ